MLYAEGKKLVFRFDDEKTWIEPWGENAFRIRATKLAEMPTEDWALLTPEDWTLLTPKDWALSTPSNLKNEITIPGEDSVATISNGKIKATISPQGKIIVYNSKGQILLEEYARDGRDLKDPKYSSLGIDARELKPILGGEYHLTMRFESVDPNERIYGMGQYQQPYLNLKGTDMELAHRNSQSSVPFALSSLGYGFLWNNPGIGRAVFGKNVMSFEAYSTKSLDYWVVAGDSPAEIEEAYAKATGYVPMMPEYGLGFWQCRLRYWNQEQVLEVAREYRRRGLPIDLIIIDYFHWKHQGEWKFDIEFFPDPDAMVKELKELKIELMVSVWPTVEDASENYTEMLEKGLLIRNDRGMRVAMQCAGDVTHFDATNPEARSYIWSKAKQNYFDKGIKAFWLDESEPEYSVYDFDIYRYHAGPNLQIGNIYPKEYAKAFYEGQTAAGQTNIVNLLRCAWAGSQKYSALVWTGDIASSWVSFRNQLAAGLSMGIAGIPWWTTDIGGFHGGNPTDPDFRELLVRWFQWGAFCPVMRLHGDREPNRVPKSKGNPHVTGADNEVWSFGDEAYPILVKYLHIRENLRDYTRGLMREAHERGTPVMRTCFYVFPDDPRCWEVETEYMFGDKYLVVPVMELGQRSIKAYLPKGASWMLWDGAEKFEGGQNIEVECPLDTMPVFVRQ